MQVTSLGVDERGGRGAELVTFALPPVCLECEPRTLSPFMSKTVTRPPAQPAASRGRGVSPPPPPEPVAASEEKQDTVVKSKHSILALERDATFKTRKFASRSLSSLEGGAGRPLSCRPKMYALPVFVPHTRVIESAAKHVNRTRDVDAGTLIVSRYRKEVEAS